MEWCPSMLPLASAILADSFWDRYSTITVSSLLYIAIPVQSSPIVLSKYGSLLGNSTMSYIQDTLGWGLGFAIPCGVMILSVITFCCGAALYTQKEQNTANKPSESIFKVLKEVVTYIITRKVRLLARADDNSGISDLELEEKALKHEFTDPREADNGHGATTPTTPNFTKTILRLLPIWTTLLIFAVNFQQPTTFFTKQGMLMNHKESFYTQVHSTMRTVGIALYLSVFGFGSFLGTFLISVLETTTVSMGKAMGGSLMIHGKSTWTSTTGSWHFSAPSALCSSRICASTTMTRRRHLGDRRIGQLAP
ncbi:hypothetical protein BAE44_0018027 [Dichanthelium oligosanthes]|uniref:Uncharacterized protein n=1 Tax=Dichanthelium oligosanthes TaxID=888268 RepID=A0A1E5V729_9POAL|nr:hypothetical protein BAE44_0018027 [Dichanthelium oligosanthes]